MVRQAILLVILLVLLPLSTMNVIAQESTTRQIGTGDYTEVYGLRDTYFLFSNSTGSTLIDVADMTEIISIPCSSSSQIRISADRNYVMCSSGIYEFTNNSLSLKFGGPISMDSTPKDNNTLQPRSYCTSPTNANSMFYNQNNPWTISNQSGVVRTIQFRPNGNMYLGPSFLHESGDKITFIYKRGTSSNFNCHYSWSMGGYLYLGTVTLGTSNTISFDTAGGQNVQSNYNNGLSLGEIQYGSTYLSGVSSNTGNDVFFSLSLAQNADAIDERGENENPPHNAAFGQATCAIRAYDAGTVTGHYIVFNGDVTMITDPLVSASCTSSTNMTYIDVDGKIVTLWSDGDEDGVNDIVDKFPFDETQSEDLDGDGFGDNPLGNQSDFCPTQVGTSYHDVLGCPDQDGDGYSNNGDSFPKESTQWNDTDSDGFGDNESGFRGDACPEVFGESDKDRFGCEDNDGDGWSDENDIFPYDSSQWSDWDGDGYGDQFNGVEGDACPADLGNSTKDRFGCVDSDGDGWSDDGDDFPFNPTQWLDRDGDGYGDNQSEQALMVDMFPTDVTQWADIDGDGHGDNPYGTEGDWFPDNPTRWQDSDRDGVADEDDAFPNERSQSEDMDGDGYGDNPDGENPDAFPSNPDEWLDTDGDFVGNNEDAFPFDPSQTTDTDGDGFGDNPVGNGADRFPGDPSQWMDIDGDGYGDNQSGTFPDAFITDPTQWSDIDGDGFGDNPGGRQADAFPNDPTQWEDLDGDGLGDSEIGNNPDPFLFDFDNDGYNDSIDPLPKLASPGDLDNDGVLDEDDLFPEDFREWADNDGDGVGDNADNDDDNDGWLDADELREGTDPFSSSEQPVDSFEIVIPGTAVGLGAWDLIGIFGGVPLFIWIGFGFITRNGRTAKYEEKLRAATTRDELESVARQWEYSLMLRMLGPHQGIRLERLRAELDDVFERQNQTLSSLEQSEYNQTQLVQDEMNQNEKEVPEINLKPDLDAVGNPDENGYEWITSEDGTNFYRTIGSGDEWIKFDD